MVVLTPPQTPGRHSTAFAALESSRRHAAVFLKTINDFLCRVKNELRRSNGSSKPKQVLAIIFRRKKKKKADLLSEAAKDFGEGGLWRREILMGGRCQPLDFPGVIYYDSNGKRLSELPMRSPRHSPSLSYLFNSAEIN